MNWAAEHEVPKSQKVSHYHVSYEEKSRSSEHCDICQNFIPADPNRCRTVVNPIAREGYCIRFKAKSKGGDHSEKE